jgi:hypothetical protein
VKYRNKLNDMRKAKKGKRRMRRRIILSLDVII